MIHLSSRPRRLGGPAHGPFNKQKERRRLFGPCEESHKDSRATLRGRRTQLSRDQRTPSPSDPQRQVSSIFFVVLTLNSHVTAPIPPLLANLDANCVSWNTNLHSLFNSFLTSHPDATGLHFCAWHFFLKVFTNPTEWGFEDEDVEKSGGAMWCDHIHPSSKMHHVLAKGITGFLTGLDPGNNSRGGSGERKWGWLWKWNKSN